MKHTMHILIIRSEPHVIRYLTFRLKDDELHLYNFIHEYRHLERIILINFTLKLGGGTTLHIPNFSAIGLILSMYSKGSWKSFSLG